jgi:hypothetical protein
MLNISKTGLIVKESFPLAHLQFFLYEQTLEGTLRR